MPDRRNLVDSVLLPNGKVFITNGQRVRLIQLLML